MSDAPVSPNAPRRKAMERIRSSIAEKIDTRTTTDVELHTFEDVVHVEHEQISKWRANRPKPAVSSGSEKAAASSGAPLNDTVGLALSGGGIRSASVCLGALQALNKTKALNSIDYISTVSGGGYAGIAAVAGMNEAKGQFTFDSHMIRDSAEMGRVRNYSSFLLPRNRSPLRNFADATVIFLRGWLANIVCVAAFLLPIALLVKLAYPVRQYLDLDRSLLSGFLYELGWRLKPQDETHCGLGCRVGRVLELAGDNLTGIHHPAFLATLLLGIVLLVWTIRRSYEPTLGNDTESRSLTWARRLLLSACVLAIAELIPAALRLRFDVIENFTVFQTWLTQFIAGAAALGGALFSGKLTQLLGGTGGQSGGFKDIARNLAIRLALLLVALIVPALIFLFFLHGTSALIEHQTLGVTCRGGCESWWREPLFWFGLSLFPIALIIVVIGPNAYSLHQFYRDRLSHSLLAVSTRRTSGQSMPAYSRPDPDDSTASPDFYMVDKMKLSELDPSRTPYLIVNAAMNLQGSRSANMRGRHADFFEFTPCYVGAKTIGYLPIKEADDRAPLKAAADIDLGTAMAISGAAVSSNMGHQSLPLLAPTLAFLNLRLGYWLANPKHIEQRQSKAWRWLRWQALVRRCQNVFLLKEMFGSINEQDPLIYLTDGGHIENLGAYALLKRKCRLIIVVDAEADPGYSMGALARLERHARIDLGVRIDLPWAQLAKAAREQHTALAQSMDATDNGTDKTLGPHAALGVIHYDSQRQGLILYVKTSLSGDERSYILDYKRQYPAFPQETTGDQFFSEAQFEAYRALGFHMLDGVLTGDDEFLWLENRYGWKTKQDALRALLRYLPHVQLPAANSTDGQASDRDGRDG